MSNIPMPPRDADSPIVRFYREWCELEKRINGPMSDDERDAIVVGELASLEERLEAEPALDARDLAIKLYVAVQYDEGRLADEIEGLITVGSFPQARSTE